MCLTARFHLEGHRILSQTLSNVVGITLSVFRSAEPKYGITVTRKWQPGKFHKPYITDNTESNIH